MTRTWLAVMEPADDYTAASLFAFALGGPAWLQVGGAQARRPGHRRGNSKTDVALVASDGTLLASARGPGINAHDVGVEADGADPRARWLVKQAAGRSSSRALPDDRGSKGPGPAGSRMHTRGRPGQRRPAGGGGRTRRGGAGPGLERRPRRWSTTPSPSCGRGDLPGRGVAGFRAALGGRRRVRRGYQLPSASRRTVRATRYLALGTIFRRLGRRLRPRPRGPSGTRRARRTGRGRGHRC